MHNYQLDMHIDIDNIQTLPDLSEALRRFTEAMLVELIQTQIEIKRAHEDITISINHWENEVKRAQNPVAQCLERPRQCLHSGSTDRYGHYHPPNCCDEQYLLEQAERHLHESCVRLNNAKLWKDKIDQAISEYLKVSTHFSYLYISHSDNARSYLERTFTKLEEILAAANSVGPIGTILGFQWGAVIPPGSLSDEQQMTYASNVLREVNAFQAETWATLDEFTRIKTLQDIEDIMAVYQNLPSSQVKSKSMDPHLLGYFDGEAIYINKSILSKSESKDVVETVLHEGRHFC